jgi:hypothetical protein
MGCGEGQTSIRLDTTEKSIEQRRNQMEEEKKGQ